MEIAQCGVRSLRSSVCRNGIKCLFEMLTLNPLKYCQSILPILLEMAGSTKKFIANETMKVVQYGI